MQVCPTGIDIRKGLQYECIGCAACIDVCDGVMDRMQYPRGLIRYATQNGLDEGAEPLALLRRVLRPRVLVYAAVLVLIVAALRHQPGAALAVPGRRGARPRRLARLVDDGGIENVYRLQVMNATEAPQRYRIAVSGLAGMRRRIRGETVVAVDPAEARWVPVAVQVAAETGGCRSVAARIP